ncbi:Crotonyl-CoA hydratase [Dyadobacter sp. CECT 9275]|uniref:Crotonyl-CoA hydratase n=1 Tax=Dyadobacter helix TaxID=2822344 RepID=A0A916J8J3_9BACT|nr:crotonase/enoyl-CoA hydratase family protein [Dyadobacter sp. CECT 9275]CAG4992679.1 Crotonyl-CoA hydratase [Dyadobacter sp. CECT 9275]
MTYKTLLFHVEDHIAFVSFNRPEKANSLDQECWTELKTVFQEINELREVRVVILAGEGKHFCSGIDLQLFQSLISSQEESCEALKSEKLLKAITSLQTAVMAIADCAKPVLAMVSGACLGAGLDIASACDVRYTSEDAFFAIKEIDLGMVADLGTLQRLPRLIPQGYIRELAFTGRNLPAKEAQQIGFVNACLINKEELLRHVSGIAAQIASKSPLATRGTKHILNYSMDHSVADGLQYVATWNASRMVSDDLKEAFRAIAEKRAPQFKN